MNTMIFTTKYTKYTKGKRRSGFRVVRVFRGLSICLLGTLSVFAAPPEGKEWEPFWPMTDEFEGEILNHKKWFDHNPTWSGRPPTLFHPDCIAVSNGMLHIAAFDSEASAKRNPPAGFTHVSGFVRSKRRARFGYFEMRAKLMNSSQVSCFWLTNAGRDEWSEIDIVEVPAGLEKYSSILQPNVHYFRGPHYNGTVDDHITDQGYHDLGFNMAEDFHVYGMEWSPTFIRWYVDGKLIREKHNDNYFQPLEMNLNVEANQWFGALPDDATLPATYQIDYVRAWRLKEY
ncbi:Beta-porphyranase B [Pontiella desulfatans]|uniref:Beta-porphyranase B n=1 Tax=Pontiella desulfatans TaxID=2750659 RepID=A0A6C2UCI6_PONDE|nr:family 16 glycosylhydrolase [Pontiella desulfatans]VGO17563.1 Beta-porphyranase B [Pontiella desulfatans]